jgi:hypothetical protein
VGGSARNEAGQTRKRDQHSQPEVTHVVGEYRLPYGE